MNCSIALRANAIVGALGLASLGLALVGTYAVATHGVAVRRKEIALRLALGATPSNVRRSFVVRGMQPIAIGMLTGAALSVAATKVVGAMFVDAAALDAATYLGVLTAFACTSLLACYVPTRSLNPNPTRTLHM